MWYVYYPALNWHMGVAVVSGLLPEVGRREAEMWEGRRRWLGHGRRAIARSGDEGIMPMLTYRSGW